MKPDSSRFNLDEQLRKAVRRFWAVRKTQAKKAADKDTGRRKAVTGGAQMDGFSSLLQTLLVRRGFPREAVFSSTRRELPGWYRSQKQWDLLLVRDRKLIAALELKSQVGSLGNNFNNRAEEAIGLAVDTKAAFREGLFPRSPRPWMGYLMLLEDTAKSTRSVKVSEPHFQVCEEFRGSSYVRRYEILLHKLVLDGMFDAACLIAADPGGARKGTYREPSPDLTFESFARSLIGRASSELIDL